MLDKGIWTTCQTAGSFPDGEYSPSRVYVDKGCLQLKVPDEQAPAKVANYVGMRTAINDIRSASQHRTVIISNVPETVHSMLYINSGIANVCQKADRTNFDLNMDDTKAPTQGASGCRDQSMAQHLNKQE